MKSEEYKRGYDAGYKAALELVAGIPSRPRVSRGDDPILRSAEPFHAIHERGVIR